MTFDVSNKKPLLVGGISEIPLRRTLEGDGRNCYRFMTAEVLFENNSSIHWSMFSKRLAHVNIGSDQGDGLELIPQTDLGLHFENLPATFHHEL